MAMQDTPPTATKSKSRTPLWAKALLMLGGVGVALGLALLVLNLFPDLLPDAFKPLRYDRAEASTTLQVQFRVGDGDTFAWMPGSVKPPEDNSVLAAFTISWDADGWRVPHMLADHYPIAAFGDSFTEGANVASPWPDKLAELLDVPVRNYGYRGYGPLEISLAAQQFAGRDRRTWMLYGFFAGNDLWEANRSEMSANRSPLELLPGLIQEAADNAAPPPPTPTDGHYDFPMPVIIGGNYYEMAFLSWLMWWQVAPPQGFEASRSFQILSDSLDKMAASVPAETCRAVMFFPTKEQLYYPYIYPSDRRYIDENAYETYIDEHGLLEQRPAPFEPDHEADFIAHLSDQRDAVQKLVESKPGWLFLDLLPVFQEAVAQGQLLYYPYDGHWNQDGVDLASQAIADFMRSHPECPLQ